ncbi:hypothetical protein LV89_03745 [Arcicella aurantiaca]|uniref:Uncharacterized protein n=1 Tax=Arcicella aurantiaca TaxID=591202 RepID=A0A316DVS7_9BACT|nr:hypothetical protein [Arcicella aurantiaca]PWK21452.1 hypothetical protein LV89_03745 [Arcicella aurantiaca]
MEEKPYKFSKREDKRYEFYSESENRKVKKLVIFSGRDDNHVYNLALLDVLEDGQYSDIIVTNNNDFQTVMATVIDILKDFLNEFPQKIVTFRGSDERRQRLYRIIITRELDIIKQSFSVFGLKNEHIELFEPNKEYELFIITKR